jgi:hypothetical protein
MIRVMTGVFVVLGVCVGSIVCAATDHATLVKGPFKSGEDVTKACLECHEKQASDFIQTTHWKWKGTPNHLEGKEKIVEEFGKANMINAVCTSIEGGKDGVVHEQCSKCHAGYGWTRTKYDFSDIGKVDCLVCHALKGNYTRAVGGTVDRKAMEKGTMNLDLASPPVTTAALAITTGVGRTRSRCLVSSRRWRKKNGNWMSIWEPGPAAGWI